MARRRFFVPEIRRDVAELTGAEAEHLVRVLRAEAGQVYEISDNQDAYLAQIETARKSQVLFRVLEKLTAPESGVHITLAAALIKFDHFEWMIEKATELGVAAIQPFEAVRSERGLTKAAAKRMPRWEKIAREASQQARRVQLPRIETPKTFAEVLETQAAWKLLLDEGEAPPILRVLPRQKNVSDIAVLLGPEGGWTDGERERAVAAGWIACSLGSTILRAETAAVAAVGVIQSAWALA
jgi:16S rRNA (uracil1498-N3)-methyltransferase